MYIVHVHIANFYSTFNISFSFLPQGITIVSAPEKGWKYKRYNKVRGFHYVTYVILNSERNCLKAVHKNN